MERRKLGESGLEVSYVGLGCNPFGTFVDGADSRAIVAEALDAGITFFDTADVYGDGESERVLGEALKGQRDAVVVATKFGNKRGVSDERPGGSRDYVRDRVAGSLRRLRMDEIDVLYYHKPDGVTPIPETLGYMWELVDEGKVRAVACSNLDTEQLGEAVSAAEDSGRPMICALQNEYSLVNRTAETGVLRICREHSIGFVPYLPLAAGLLTSKHTRLKPPVEGTRLAVPGYESYLREECWDIVESAQEFAEGRGRTLLEVAMGSLCSRPEVTSVIPGASRPEQVRQNLAAAEWRLTDDDLRQLDATLGS